VRKILESNLICQVVLKFAHFQVLFRSVTFVNSTGTRGARSRQSYHSDHYDETIPPARARGIIAIIMGAVRFASLGCPEVVIVAVTRRGEHQRRSLGARFDFRRASRHLERIRSTTHYANCFVRWVRNPTQRKRPSIPLQIIAVQTLSRI
jgi:hypothetical protein